MATLLEVLGLAPLRGAARPPADAAAALDLARKPGDAPSAPGPTADELARRTLGAKALRTQLEPLRNADPDARPDEWAPVQQQAAAGLALLGGTPPSAADIANASACRDRAVAAAQAARQMIRARLDADAASVRERLAALPPYPDAEGSEWSKVAQAVAAAAAAMPADKPNAAQIAQARQHLQVAEAAAQVAREAISARLRAAAQAVRDKLVPLRVADPEATSDEWAPVLSACQAVEQALPATGLTGKDIAAAGKLVAAVPEIVAKAREAIQARLRAAARPILDKAHALAAGMPPHVLAPEWGPVVTACGAVDAAVAPASITAADVTKAQAALDAAQKAAQVARNGAGLRLAREIGSLADGVTNTMQPQCGLDKEEWKPVQAACEAVRQAAPKEPTRTVPAEVDEARRRADAVPAAVSDALQKAWEKRRNAERDTLNAVITAATLDKPQLSVVSTQLKTLPGWSSWEALKAAAAPTDAATFQRKLAELKGLRSMLEAAVKPIVKAVKAGDPVPAAPDDAAERFKLLNGFEAVLARLEAERVECTRVIALAKEPRPFRAFVKAADEALTTASKELGSALERLLESAVGKKGWRTATPWTKVANPAQACEAFDFKWCTEQLAYYEKQVTELAKARTKTETDVSGLIRLWGSGGVPAVEREQLECLIRFVELGLNCKTAEKLRKALANPKSPVAVGVWRSALQADLDEQLTGAIPGTTWASRFGMSTAARKKDANASGQSWGIDAVSQIDGIDCHLTLYPEKVSAPLNQSAAQIVAAICGSGTGGVHATIEANGKDHADNAKYYNGGDMRGKNQAKYRNQLKAILDTWMAGLPAIAQGYKDRRGLNVEQVAANVKYVSELKGELAKLD